MAAVSNSVFQEKAEWLWSLMDISDNLNRAKKECENVGNDFVTSCVYLLVFSTLTAIAAALAYHFDFESTFVGMQTLQNVVIPNLPSSVQQFSTWLTVGFTLAPTLIELFTAGFARAQIKIIQLFVIGLTAFDLITDIPRAISFTNSLNAHFDQLGGLFGFLAHWSFFIFWLFLSTIGFELSAIIFAFVAVTFLFKTLKLQKQRSTAVALKSVPNTPQVKTKPVVIETE